jgi:hypothetical protein
MSADTGRRRRLAAYASRALVLSAVVVFTGGVFASTRHASSPPTTGSMTSATPTADTAALREAWLRASGQCVDRALSVVWPTVLDSCDESGSARPVTVDVDNSNCRILRESDQPVLRRHVSAAGQVTVPVCVLLAESDLASSHSSSQVGSGISGGGPQHGSGYDVTCADGWVSHAGGRKGACSHHGGVG